ncbi:uncharacterized protein M421DRAFT_361215 [Didymella exigua CBS 183.55]|uniref:Uncharacterized protein n=1 Tax=Didymella exigua CBS 183.55 TaxID=1150837 RepID=A0A6A5S023_9PLEO|nr:uncharacterized protein M421DRAFT_361215 [Didymella exigua CBS 183.55]KAF1930857.1 hypothetical protein M421DRAFT_361215 [Didymella exigua CBS 183.55]
MSKCFQSCRATKVRSRTGSIPVAELFNAVPGLRRALGPSPSTYSRASYVEPHSAVSPLILLLLLSLHAHFYILTLWTYSFPFLFWLSFSIPQSRFN